MSFLLHVHEQQSAWSGNVQAGLQRSGLRVEVCTNVYTAMTRLIQNADDTCLGLFLCVDWFSDAEADFLAALNRLPKPVTVWGYANRPVCLPVDVCGDVRMIDDAGQVDFILAKILQTSGATANRGQPAPPQPAARAANAAPPPQGLPVPWGDRSARPARKPPSAAPSDALLSNEEIDALTAAPPLNPHSPDADTA